MITIVDMVVKPPRPLHYVRNAVRLHYYSDGSYDDEPKVLIEFYDDSFDEAHEEDIENTEAERIAGQYIPLARIREFLSMVNGIV